MPELPPFTWEGFDNPAYTPVPDDVFDKLLTRLSDAELRVLLYLIRRTFGFKKSSDAVSLSQLVQGITTHDGRVLDEGCGLSKAGVARGLKGLIDKGIILAQHNRSAKRGDEPTSYTIRMRAAAPPVSTKETPPVSTKETGGVSFVDTPLSAERHPRVSFVDTQETVVQETVRQERNDSNRIALQKKERGTTTTIRRRVNTAGEGTPPPDARPRPALSSYIAGVIEDISRDLGDLEHSNSNITQALRLWQEADLDEEAFVALLREVKGTVRHYQAGGIGNKMAYFFQTLRDRVSKQDGHA